MTCKESEMHPSERKLLEDCRKIGLDEKNTNVLRELFGWANRQDPFGPRYRLIMCEIQNVMLFLYGDPEPLKNVDNAMAYMTKEMSSLIYALMGEELARRTRENPIHVFENILHLSLLQTTWLIVQFRLKEHYSRVATVIQSLSYYSPEKIGCVIVTPVIVKLMERRLTGF